MDFSNLTFIFTTPITGTGISMGDIFWFLFTLSIFIIIAKTITVYLKKAFTEKIPKNDLNLILKIIYYVIIIIGVMMALPNIVEDLSGLLVAGGIAGVIIGFASQSVVANLISGIFLIVERPIMIGDNIFIDETYAVVEDIRIMSTIVRTFDGVYVRIPNEKVFTSNITNFVINVARRFEYTIGISYQDDASRAIAIIKEVLDKEPLSLKNPGPSIYVDELADNSVNIVVRIWAPSSVWWDVRTRMLQEIKTALDAEGIDIPFPQRTIWFADTLKTERKAEEIHENAPPSKPVSYTGSPDQDSGEEEGS